MPARLLAIAALAAGLTVAGYAAAFGINAHHDRARLESELAGLGRGVYSPQKVVYHVDYGSGWRGRAYEELLSALDNHVKAVGADKMSLVVMLQGSGADLLVSAKSTPRLAQRIDALRRQGVRFLVCRNTLLGRLIDPFSDLYGVTERDIATAAVAELVALQQEGYLYLHL